MLVKKFKKTSEWVWEQEFLKMDLNKSKKDIVMLSRLREGVLHQDIL